MSQKDGSLNRSIAEVLVLAAAAPALSIWALVSLLPLVSVISAWGDLYATLIALAFLGTGALGVLAGFAGARLLLWKNASLKVQRKAQPRQGYNKRLIYLTAYALLWITFYGFYTLG